MDGTILVTGASGTIGSRVLKELQARGASVRAISRDVTQVEKWKSKGIDAAVADPTNLETAAQGCKQMLLISPGAPGQFGKERAAIGTARRHGVERIVKISAGDANPGSPCAWAAAHGMSDDYLVASGLPHCILRASAYMSNLNWFSEPIKRGFMPHAAGKGASSWIDPDDIARCAAAVLLDRNETATYYLNSAEMLTFDDVAERLSSTLNRRIRAISLPGWVYHGLLRVSGVPEFYARGLTAQYAVVMRGGHDEPGISHDVELLTGRKPTSFLQYMQTHGAPQSAGFKA